MPIFQYRAANLQKKVLEGSMAAPTKEEVAQLLKKQGLDPLTIKLANAKGHISGSLPPIDRIALCRYLSTMLTAGVSLASGIPSLKKETKNALLKQILDDILYNLERGQPISSALSNYPKVFDKFFLTLLRTGEVSGTLAESFKYLEKQLRAEYSLSTKVKGAMVYPAIVFLAMMGIGFLMFFFVLPQIGRVFLTMTIPLPAATRFIFTFSLGIANYRYPLIALTIIAMIALYLFIRKPAGKHLVMKLIAPIPVVSVLLQEIDIARFCRIFSTLVSSAVPITQALDISLSSMNHPRFRVLHEQVIPLVTQGKTLSDAFGAYPVFPALLTQMLSAGEKSGTLDSSLGDLADFYEEEVEEAVKKTTQILEPVVMLMVGIGVGAMIIMIIAPLYSVVGNLQLAR